MTALDRTQQRSSGVPARAVPGPVGPRRPRSPGSASSTETVLGAGGVTLLAIAGAALVTKRWPRGTGLGTHAAAGGALDGAIALRRTADPAELDRIERLLARGSVVPGSRQRLGAHGASGPLERVVLVDAGESTRRMPVVLKQAQAAQEEFAYRVARALGIDYLVPTTARRADGTAAIRFIDGVHFDRAQIADAHDLRRAIATSYELEHCLSPAEAADAARLDHELLQFLDWLLANRDRKAANTIAETATGRHLVIDHGAAFRGERIDVLRPRLKDRYYLVDPDHPNRINLGADTRAVIRDQLTDDRLTTAHAGLRSGPAPADPDERLYLARARSARQLERILTRRDAALERGYIEFAPVTKRSRRWEARLDDVRFRTGAYSTWGGRRAARLPSSDDAGDRS